MSIQKVRSSQIDLPPSMATLEARDNTVVEWAKAKLEKMRKAGVPQEQLSAKLADRISHRVSPIKEEGRFFPRFISPAIKEQAIRNFAKSRTHTEEPAAADDAIIVDALKIVEKKRGDLRMQAAGTAALAATHLFGVTPLVSAGSATAATTAAAAGGITPATLSGVSGGLLAKWLADTAENAAKMVAKGVFKTEAAATEFYISYGTQFASELKVRETVIRRLLPGAEAEELLRSSRAFGSDFFDGLLHKNMSPVSSFVDAARENPSLEAIQRAEEELNKYLNEHPGVEKALRNEMKKRLETFKREKMQRNSQFTILVVDSDPKDVTATLSNEGYSVRHAGTSRQADQILRQEKISAVVIERMIPQDEGEAPWVGHGDGLIRELRSNPENKVIVYTDKQPSFAETAFMRTKHSLKRTRDHEYLICKLQEELKQTEEQKTKD